MSPFERIDITEMGVTEGGNIGCSRNAKRNMTVYAAQSAANFDVSSQSYMCIRHSFDKMTAVIPLGPNPPIFSRMPARLPGMVDVPGQAVPAKRRRALAPHCTLGTDQARRS